MKFCKDCANWHQYCPGGDCWIPTGEISPVNGSAVTTARYAWNERRSNSTIFGRAKCGPEGRFFVAKLEVKP